MNGTTQSAQLERESVLLTVDHMGTLVVVGRLGEGGGSSCRGCVDLWFCRGCLDTVNDICEGVPW